MKFYRIREECYHRNILQHILSSCTMTIFIETCFNTLYVPPMMQKCPCHDKEDSPHPPSSSGGVTRSHLVQRWTLIVLKEFSQKTLFTPIELCDFTPRTMFSFLLYPSRSKWQFTNVPYPVGFRLQRMFSIISYNHDAVKYHLRVQLIGILDANKLLTMSHQIFKTLIVKKNY